MKHNFIIEIFCLDYSVWVVQWAAYRTPACSTCAIWRTPHQHGLCTPWHTRFPIPETCGNIIPTTHTMPSTATTTIPVSSRSAWCWEYRVNRRQVSISPALPPAHYQTTTSRQESALFRTWRLKVRKVYSCVCSTRKFKSSCETRTYSSKNNIYLIT